MATQTATATSDGDATTGAAFTGLFLVSISGLDTDSVVAFQRSHDSGTTWKNIETFTNDIEENAYAPGSSTYYRLLVKSMGQSSSIALRLEN